MCLPIGSRPSGNLILRPNVRTSALIAESVGSEYDELRSAFGQDLPLGEVRPSQSSQALFDMARVFINRVKCTTNILTQF